MKKAILSTAVCVATLVLGSAPALADNSRGLGTGNANNVANLNGDSASDRVIINPAGVDKTGSGVTPLKSVRNNKSETVGYLVANPNARYIQAGLGVYANGGRNTLPGRPIDNIDP